MYKKVLYAIGGIIAVVILAFVAGLSFTCQGRCPAPDAAIISDLFTIQTEAKTFYAQSQNTYGVAVPLGTSEAACELPDSLFAEETITKAIAGAEKNGATLECISTGAPADAYAFEASLPGLPAHMPYFCIDSSGYASTTIARLTSAKCPI